MLVDAHAHIDRYEMEGEMVLEAALDEIRENRILTMSASMDPESYERAQALAERCDLILPIFGIHPWNAPKYVDRLEDFREPIAESPILGEIGLDFHFVKNTSEYPAQKKVLEFFFRAAAEQDKAVNLHTKGAEETILEMMDDHDIRRAIIHWYSGPLDILEKLVDRGSYFTVGPEVIYSHHIRAIARKVPLERLLTETDNPGGPKELMRGPGMPILVKRVLQKIAEVREIPEEEIQAKVLENLHVLLGEAP